MICLPMINCKFKFCFINQELYILLPMKQSKFEVIIVGLQQNYVYHVKKVKYLH